MESYSSGNAPRRCRVSMACTVLTVQRALSSWCQIFLYPQIEFRPVQERCSGVQKAVKNLLKSCPSSVESERMAYQSIKKLLPPSCKCMEEELLTNLRATLTRSAPSLPSGYVRFVRRKIESQFRKGWDVGLYSGFCYTNTPSLSGTVDSSRLEGGMMGAVTDHVSLLDRTLGAHYETLSCDGQLMVVQSAGKPRPLTKFRSSDLVLRPLHKSLYEHLSRTTKWLCRGDPTGEKLKRAGFVRGGGVLVSGDYRGATDNLSLEVAELILQVILDNAVSVPPSVKDHAMKMLRPTLWNLEYGLEFQVSRGQMMGSFLSFPLLCIQNFLGFEYAREKAGLGFLPLIINGDDILFQSPSSFPESWMSVVKGIGLEVEETKTSVSPSFGTLNSTLFEWEGDFLRVVPTLRFGMLRRPDFLNSLGPTFHSFVRGLPTEVAWKAARTFFSWHLSSLKSVRCRPDELGFRGSLAFRMSRIFGLLDHDLRLFDLPRAPLPHTVVLDHSLVTMVPEEALSPELKLVNDREMASWKFSVDFVNLRSQSAIRYCLQLSDIRRPEIDYSSPKWRTLTDSFSWRAIRRRRFFRPSCGRVRVVPVFDNVLLSQVTSDWELPPTYEEVIEGLCPGDTKRDGGTKLVCAEPKALSIAPTGLEPRGFRRPDIFVGGW